MQSLISKSLLLLMLWSFSFGAFAAERLNVVFINPGKSSEAYWQMVTSFMRAAADQLDIELEVLWAERNHLEQVKIGEDIAKRSQKPDYVVLVNEKSVAPETIKPLDAAGIKTFLILNDLTDEQKKNHGTPRTTYRHWIGTMVPDNVDAGYKIARSMFDEVKKRTWTAPEMLVISGSRVTPASTQRREGLDKALAKYKALNIKLTQEVWSEFDGDKAYEQTKFLFKRYPNLKIIWAANDPMALGAMKAAREHGRTPGKDIIFGGLNWSDPALKAVKSGEMAVTVGGHFMCGGWSLVAIHDYAKGIDFAKTEGIEMKPEVFGAIDAGNVDSYLTNYADQNWSKIDFSKFSKKQTPKLKKYDFSLNTVIRSVKP